MKINKIFDYSKLERETSKSGVRHYVQPDGKLIPSVTTILSATSDKTGLQKWQDRVGLVEANRIRNEAAGLGSLMHDHLEKYIQGIERPSGSNVVRQLAANMADQIINRALVKVDEVWGIEQSLYCKDIYAGTTDVCCIYDGSPSIVDFKTTNKMKKREYIEDYSLQLAAYQMAHDEMFGTKIKKGVVLMVSRNLEFEEFIFEGNELAQCGDRWLARLEQYFSLT